MARDYFFNQAIPVNAGGMIVTHQKSALTAPNFNKNIFCVLTHQNNCIFKSEIILQKNVSLTHQNLTKNQS
jgi:hypothetical protein